MNGTNYSQEELNKTSNIQTEIFNDTVAKGKKPEIQELGGRIIGYQSNLTKIPDLNTDKTIENTIKLVKIVVENIDIYEKVYKNLFETDSNIRYLLATFDKYKNLTTKDDLFDMVLSMRNDFIRKINLERTLTNITYEFNLFDLYISNSIFNQTFGNWILRTSKTLSNELQNYNDFYCITQIWKFNPFINEIPTNPEINKQIISFECLPSDKIYGRDKTYFMSFLKNDSYDYYYIFMRKVTEKGFYMVESVKETIITEKGSPKEVLTIESNMFGTILIREFNDELEEGGWKIGVEVLFFSLMLIFFLYIYFMKSKRN